MEHGLKGNAQLLEDSKTCWCFLQNDIRSYVLSSRIKLELELHAEAGG